MSPKPAEYSGRLPDCRLQATAGRFSLPYFWNPSLDVEARTCI